MRREVLVTPTSARTNEEGTPLHDGFLTFAARLVQVLIPLELFVLLGMASEGFRSWEPERVAGCGVVGLGLAALMGSRLALVPRIYAVEGGLSFHWIWRASRHVAWQEIREIEAVTALGRQIQPRFKLYFVDIEQEPLEFFADSAFCESVSSLRRTWAAGPTPACRKL
jgi:hypothetical protein